MLIFIFENVCQAISPTYLYNPAFCPVFSNSEILNYQDSFALWRIFIHFQGQFWLLYRGGGAISI